MHHGSVRAHQRRLTHATYPHRQHEGAYAQLLRIRAKVGDHMAAHLIGVDVRTLNNRRQSAPVWRATQAFYCLLGLGGRQVRLHDVLTSFAFAQAPQTPQEKDHSRDSLVSCGSGGDGDGDGI